MLKMLASDFPKIVLAKTLQHLMPDLTLGSDFGHDPRIALTLADCLRSSNDFSPDLSLALSSQIARRGLTRTAWTVPDFSLWISSTGSGPIGTSPAKAPLHFRRTSLTMSRVGFVTPRRVLCLKSLQSIYFSCDAACQGKGGVTPGEYESAQSHLDPIGCQEPYRFLGLFFSAIFIEHTEKTTHDY